MRSGADRAGILRSTAALLLIRVAALIGGVGDGLLRPREVHLVGEADGAGVEALVVRLVALGSDWRVKLRLADGATVWGRVTSAEAQELELHEGQIIAVRLLGAAAEAPELARA
jgi:hypothetical protein